MIIRKNISLVTIILTVVLLVGFAGSSYCQLLFRPEMERENYARTGYHLYGRTQIARSSNPRYDSFGNFVMNGVNIFHWNEEKINSKHILPGEKNSILDKVNPIDYNEYFEFYLDNLVVLSETTKAFSSRFIVGNEIRVKFSPLTVDMAAMNGIRWDMNFANNNVTLISSRADLPIWFPNDSQTDYMRERELPVYLTGAHIERKLGVFNIAANYVNTYKTDSTQSRYNNSMTGTVAHEGRLPKPRQLVVKLEDGSRFDGGGPRIYDIYPIVNGEPMPKLLVGVSKGNWKDDFAVTRKTGDPNKELYTARYFLDPLRVPGFAEFNELKQ